MSRILKHCWVVLLFASISLAAQMQFTSDATIDVWQAGVRATTLLGNTGLMFSSDRILRFNVIWGLQGPTVTGALTKGGWTKTLQLGVSSGGVANRTTTESLAYEVKVVQVSDETAIVVVVWTRTDSATGDSEAGTIVICTINKTAPNRISPAEDGARMSSVGLPADGSSQGTSAGRFAAGMNTGGVGGSWQEVMTHGQYSYTDSNGKFVTVGWISYGYIWVPSNAKRRVNELY